MNALALFWVTDSLSERSAGGPNMTGASVTLAHPVYEMSSRISKDPGSSFMEVVPPNHRQSRSSWFPMAALDRSFRTMFVREPPPKETGTVDVEVSPQLDRYPARSLRPRNSDRNPH